MANYHPLGLYAAHLLLNGPDAARRYALGEPMSYERTEADNMADVDERSGIVFGEASDIDPHQPDEVEEYDDLGDEDLDDDDELDEDEDEEDDDLDEEEFDEANREADDEDEDDLDDDDFEDLDDEDLDEDAEDL